MEKSSQFMASPVPGGSISGVEICAHDSRRTRYDAIGEHFFSATEWSLVAWARLVAEFRGGGTGVVARATKDRKSTRLNSSHVRISYAVFCLKKKINLPMRFG